METLIFFNFFKVLGLAPVSLEIDESKSLQWTISSSKIGIFYNVFLIFLIAPLNYMAIKFMYDSNYEGNTSIDTSIIVFEDVIIASSTILTVASYSCVNHKMLKLLKKINFAREISLAIETTVKIDNIIIVVTLMCFTNVILIIVILVFSQQVNVLHFLYYFIILLDTLIVTLVIFQYSVILNWIHNMFLFINQNLIEISIKSNNTSKLQNSGLILKIDQLMRLYILLCEISEEVSEFYSFPMIWSVLEVFISVLHGMYFSVKDIIILNKGITQSSVIDLSTFYLSFSSIIVLTIYVSNAYREIDQTGVLLNQCKRRFKCVAINEKLEEFLDNILHENVNFSVFKFFSLDESFLLSFSGTVLKYIVILLQFHGLRKNIHL